MAFWYPGLNGHQNTKLPSTPSGVMRALSPSVLLQAEQRRRDARLGAAADALEEADGSDDDNVHVGCHESEFGWRGSAWRNSAEMADRWMAEFRLAGFRHDGLTMDSGAPPGGIPPRWPIVDSGVQPGGIPPRWQVDGWRNSAWRDAAEMACRWRNSAADRSRIANCFFWSSCDHDSHRDADTNKLNAYGRPGERRRDVEHAVVAIAMDVDVSHYVGAASVAVDVAVVVAVRV